MTLPDKKKPPSAFPSIEPVPAGVKRPFFSVMIPVYNQREEYLEKTLRSVLDQDLGPEEMQIEVVDDGSTNGVPEKVIKGLSTDRIGFSWRTNVGLSRIWNICIQRARGRLVHILHSDDLVLPGFYQGIRGVFDREPAIGAAFCRYVYIDEDGDWISLSDLEMKKTGILPDWLERIGVRCYIQCPAIVVKRSVYEELGGFHLELVYAMDWEMWKRIAVRYPFGFLPTPLACFRTHSGTQTSRQIRSGVFLADNRRSIDISRTYLPKSISARLTRKAKEDIALYSLNILAYLLYRRKDYWGVYAQLVGSLQCSGSPRVIERVIRFLLWAWVQKIRMLIGIDPL